MTKSKTDKHLTLSYKKTISKTYTPRQTHHTVLTKQKNYLQK